MISPSPIDRGSFFSVGLYLPILAKFISIIVTWILLCMSLDKLLSLCSFFSPWLLLKPLFISCVGPLNSPLEEVLCCRTVVAQSRWCTTWWWSFGGCTNCCMGLLTRAARTLPPPLLFLTKVWPGMCWLDGRICTANFSVLCHSHKST